MSEPATSAACEHILEQLYQFHDHELTEAEATEIREHLMACEPCLDRYDVEQALRLLIRRCCAAQAAPETLRMRIRTTVTRTVIVTEG
ncbi:MAG: mycothiol system anti-sigma-R factor [Actinobacteria bacterium]|nr:mycothiol system anti-sigma-R factor [Actinomycetota bacterium]